MLLYSSRTHCGFSQAKTVLCRTLIADLTEDLQVTCRSENDKSTRTRLLIQPHEKLPKGNARSIE